MSTLDLWRGSIPARGAKGFTQPTAPVSFFGGQSLLGTSLLPATKKDYAAQVGDGLRSSVLVACLTWLMRNFPEAPPIVERINGAMWEEFPSHNLLPLLKNPNPYYSGTQLFMATVLDFAFGNAYWVKLRNAAGEVVQIWWVPAALMRPVWPLDGSVFISHYLYWPGPRQQEIAVEDVVHFRFGLDPHNPRLGFSPLAALVREIAMDDNAANFAAAILENMGVIGVVISPEAGAAGKQALEETKAYIKENFRGDNRANPLALGSPTKVQLLQYNMQGFDVSPLRDVSEERVCATLGIPAAVVGFGTGLQQTKVGATMSEMRQLAWTSGLMPIQKMISDEIDRSLLPEFPAEKGKRMRFDTTHVRALWEDSKAKHERVRLDYIAGIIMRSEARRETGRPFTDADKVFAQPVNLGLISPDGKPMQTRPADPTVPPADDTVTTDTTNEGT